MTPVATYLLKSMGKQVFASDFLNFPTVLASATVANSKHRIDANALKQLVAVRRKGPHFIEETFGGVFFATSDLQFLDRVSANIDDLAHPQQRALAKAALIRSRLKKQPRGVFTISGDLSHYDDGRRDLRLSIEEHFSEQVTVFNKVVFDNGKRHAVKRADVFRLKPTGVDLAYLDPPYVPRSDDNCYMKRYHFLEGLSCYWRGVRIMQDTSPRTSSPRGCMVLGAAQVSVSSRTARMLWAFCPIFRASDCWRPWPWRPIGHRTGAMSWSND